MKRYLLFTYEIYYPGGGWNDYIKDFDSIQEAKDYILANKDDPYIIKDFVQIVDIDNYAIVYEA